jgi:hypothetical protein
VARISAVLLPTFPLGNQGLIKSDTVETSNIVHGMITEAVAGDALLLTHPKHSQDASKELGSRNGIGVVGDCGDARMTRDASSSVTFGSREERVHTH